MDRQKARQKAVELVEQMTVEEMASQMRYDAPAIPRLQISAYNWWNEGLHGVARGGTATVFPQAIGLAAMFDEETMRSVADAVSTEGRAKYNEFQKEGDTDIYKGLTYWTPNVNIFRDPRWGRGHETYGEDPYLTSRLGVAFVKGLQGEPPVQSILPCIPGRRRFAMNLTPPQRNGIYGRRICLHLRPVCRKAAWNPSWGHTTAMRESRAVPAHC